MFDNLPPVRGAWPTDASTCWPDERLPWVAEARKSAPGLDSLLRWAFELEASRVAFQTSQPVWLRVHGRARAWSSSAAAPAPASPP